MEGLEYHLVVLVMSQHNPICILENSVKVVGRGPDLRLGPVRMGDQR